MKNHFTALVLFVSLFMGVCSAQDQTRSSNPDDLKGKWILHYLTPDYAQNPIRATLIRMFPVRIPTMTFDVKKQEVRGDSGCSPFDSKYIINGNKINFADNLRINATACKEVDQNAFIRAIRTVDSFYFEDDWLVFTKDGEEIMKWKEMTSKDTKELNKKKEKAKKEAEARKEKLKKEKEKQAKAKRKRK